MGVSQLLSFFFMPTLHCFVRVRFAVMTILLAISPFIENARSASSAHAEVLFIGNSFTFYHDMPQMFQQIAQAAGKDVHVDEFVQGGQTLQGFWNDPKHEALERINSKPWDYVVLQGWNDPAADMRDGGTKFMAEIFKVNPKAIVLMYMVSPTGPYPDDAALADQQRQFAALATANTVLVPVEWAWKQGFKEDPSNTKWLAQDNWHPGPRRSYIAAVSMYATIFHEPIRGLSSKFTYPAEGDLTPEDARYLQDLAWTALRSHSNLQY